MQHGSLHSDSLDSSSSSQLRHARSMEAWKSSPLRTQSLSSLTIPDDIHLDLEESDDGDSGSHYSRRWGDIWEGVDVPGETAEIQSYKRSSQFSFGTSRSSVAANPPSPTSSLFSTLPPTSLFAYSGSSSSIDSNASSSTSIDLKKRSRFGLKAKRGLDVFGGKGKWSSSDKPKDGKGNAQKPEDWEKSRSSTGRGGAGNIRSLSTLDLSRTRSKDSNPSLNSAEERDIVLDIRKRTPEEYELFLRNQGDVHLSPKNCATSDIVKSTTQVSFAIPCTHACPSLCSSHSQLPDSNRLKDGCHSSAPYHALPMIAEADDIVSLTKTAVSATTFAYLRPYASSEAADRATPSSQASSSNQASRSPANSSPLSHLPVDYVKATIGREFHVDLGPFVEQFARAMDTSPCERSGPSDPEHAEINIPTHTGTDPPSTSLGRHPGDTQLATIISTSSPRRGKRPVESPVPDTKQLEEALKRKLRTGRGGLGNPSGLIVKRMKRAYKRSTGLVPLEMRNELELAQERMVIEQNKQKTRVMHSTGRGGAGNFKGKGNRTKAMTPTSRGAKAQGVHKKLFGLRRGRETFVSN